MMKFSLALAVLSTLLFAGVSEAQEIDAERCTAYSELETLIASMPSETLGEMLDLLEAAPEDDTAVSFAEVSGLPMETTQMLFTGDFDQDLLTVFLLIGFIEAHHPQIHAESFEDVAAEERAEREAMMRMFIDGARAQYGEDCSSQ